MERFGFWAISLHPGHAGLHKELPQLHEYHNHWDESWVYGYDLETKLFPHFPYNENPRALNTTSFKCCLQSTDAIDRWGKNTCMHIKDQGCLMQVHFIEIHQGFTKRK